MEKKPRSKLEKLLYWFSDRKAEQRAEVERLAASDDVNAVGPLIDALKSADRQTRDIIEKALIRLLLRLRDTDATLLNFERRNHLYRALEGKNLELILSILKSFEQIGDWKELSYVERLAAGLGKGQVAREKRVRQAASECLPFLQARMEKSLPSITLLRAASAPAPPSDNLLHPSTAPSVPLSTLRRSAEDTSEPK
jgi:hypothetical protein